MKLSKMPLFLSAAFIALGFSSCSLSKISEPAPPTDFISSTGVDTSVKTNRVPFDHWWRSPDAKISQYKNIVIRPVTTAYLRKDEWANSASGYIPDEQAYVSRCNELAGYFGKSLKNAYSKTESSFAVAGSITKPDTLTLEVALTEVTFGRPEGYIGSMVVPGGGLLNSAAASPICAFEARLRDSSTGKLVATAADRRGSTLKVIDFNQFTYHKANQEICDQWTQQIMEATNKDLFPKVKKSTFSFF